MPAFTLAHTLRRTSDWPARTAWQAVLAGLAVFAAVWLPLLDWTSLAPPVDNIEQLTWMRALAWGYFKHPPLPTWLLAGAAQAMGATAWTSYALGAACTLGSMALMWRLVAGMRGERHATIALLSALCITFYNGRLHYYNHNVVLMLMSTASAALCWQAFRTRQRRWWLALGIAVGLGALAKYQIAITLVSIGLFATHQRAWRDPVHRAGAAIGAAAASLIVAPHVGWLFHHDFAPWHYAVESSLGAGFGLGHRVSTSMQWLADQVLNRSLPAWIVLAAAARSGGTVTDVRAPAVRPDPAPRALLLAWGVAPLVLMTAIGLATGADLQLQWGTAFLPFVVPAVMELWPHGAWSQVAPHRALRAFLVVQALLLLTHLASSPRAPESWRDHHWRQFDAAALAGALAAPARAQLQGPVRLVVGPTGPAGALALQWPERPLVLIDGRFDRSPWVAPSLLAQCGALELGRPDSLPGGTPLGERFPDLAWRIVPREPDAAPCPPLRTS